MNQREREEGHEGHTNRPTQERRERKKKKGRLEARLGCIGFKEEDKPFTNQTHFKC